MGALTNRVRIERRGDLVTSDAVEWDEGGDVENDDGGSVDFVEAGPGDGYGNASGDWRRIGPAQSLRCEIRELRLGADEAVISEKLQGVQPCLVMIRNSRFARSIRVEDRIVELLDGGGERVINIRTAPPPGRNDRYITLFCESGVAT